MSRGDQRDRDRARAEARKAKNNPKSAKDKDGLSALQRKERCEARGVCMHCVCSQTHRRRDMAALAAKKAAKEASKAAEQGK